MPKPSAEIERTWVSGHIAEPVDRGGLEPPHLGTSGRRILEDLILLLE